MKNISFVYQIKEDELNAHFLKLTHKFKRHLIKRVIISEIMRHYAYAHPIHTHSKLQACMSCSGSNHLITTQLNHYHILHKVVYVLVFLNRTPVFFRKFIPCSTTAD